MKSVPIIILAMLMYLFGIAAVSFYYATHILDVSQYQQTLLKYGIHWQLYSSSNEASNPSHLPEIDKWSWILETNEFVPNQYQRTPYVSNGYIGQRLPAEGVGYWIDIDEYGKYVNNCQPCPSKNYEMRADS